MASTPLHDALTLLGLPENLTREDRLWRTWRHTITKNPDAHPIDKTSRAWGTPNTDPDTGSISLTRYELPEHTERLLNAALALSSHASRDRLRQTETRFRNHEAVLTYTNAYRQLTQLIADGHPDGPGARAAHAEINQAISDLEAFTATITAPEPTTGAILDTQPEGHARHADQKLPGTLRLDTTPLMATATRSPASVAKRTISMPTRAKTDTTRGPEGPTRA